MAPLPNISELVSRLHLWSGYIRDVLAQTSVKNLTGAIVALSARDIAPDVPSCPGYTLTSVAQMGNSITANLQLAGQACNMYGTDLGSLQLLVEYQTGENRAMTTAHCSDPRLEINHHR
jgi:hypothetical protein